MRAVMERDLIGEAVDEALDGVLSEPLTKSYCIGEALEDALRELMMENNSIGETLNEVISMPLVEI